MFQQVRERQFGYFLTVLLSTCFTCVTCNVGPVSSEQTRNRQQQRPCLFPSVHQRVAIYECQNSGISLPTETYHSVNAIWWCPLTDNFDHYPEWRICPETATTYGGNHPGNACHFPFRYQGRLQRTCVRSGGGLHFDPSSGALPGDTGDSGYWWCATTANFDRDRQWTRCRPYQAHQLPCHFGQPTRQRAVPLIGGQIGSLDDECQPFSGHWVCKTELGQLRECPSVSDADAGDQQTEGGNHPGFQCHFPFQATLPLSADGFRWIGPSEKRNFSTCLPGTAGITSDAWRGQEAVTMYPAWIGYWCATTENFDRDRLWTRCGVHTTAVGGTSLAAIWSHLGWFTQLSDWERRRLQRTSSGVAYNRDFQTVLSSLERQRMLFKQNRYREEAVDNQLSWWTWLAPLWWASYLANHTQPIDSRLQETKLSLDMEESDPLSKAFHLPDWVKDWSPSGWQSFGLTMRQRWVHMQRLVDRRTTRNWLVAYATGLATALLLLLACVLITCACADRTRRSDAVRLFCGPLQGKPGKWSAGSHRKCSAGKYWSEAYSHPSHGRSAEPMHCRHSKSIDSEACTLTGEIEEPRKRDTFFECDTRNVEFLPLSDSEETKRSRSLNRESKLMVQHDPAYVQRSCQGVEVPDLHGTSCSHCLGVCRPSECVYHKQQLDELLRMVFAHLRRSHNEDHCNDQILRLCSQLREQLRVSIEQPHQLWCGNVDKFPARLCCPPPIADYSPPLHGQVHCQLCTPVEAGPVTQHRCSESVTSNSPEAEPSAPPPSYEQFEKENSNALSEP